MSIPYDVSVERICFIVDIGMSSKIIRAAKVHKLYGATIMLGKGTASHGILHRLGLADVRKGIIWMVADKKSAKEALEAISREFELWKPNHGIAFTTSVCFASGSHMIHCDISNEEGEGSNMYHAINVIVEKGRAEEVIDAATKAGSKGGTIINARGSGIHETSKLFTMEIEPEKEIVLILSEVEATEKIVESIRRDLQLDEPGNGILFIQNVNQTYGIAR